MFPGSETGGFYIRDNTLQSGTNLPPDVINQIVTDYLLEPAGTTPLGEPLISAMVDQSDTAAYAASRDEDGFVGLGEIEISLDETGEAATVVVKLSSPGNESYSGVAPLLLADAVRLVRID